MDGTNHEFGDGSRAPTLGGVTYDPLAEAVRLIRARSPDRIDGLSRRRRFVPVAVDVNGMLPPRWFCVGVFVRRGQMNTCSTVANDGWVPLGGGSGGDASDLMGPRPSEDDIGGFARRLGGGGSTRDVTGVLAGEQAWVGSTSLWLARGVAAALIGDRAVRVPNHGITIVVWEGEHETIDHASRFLQRVLSGR